MLESLLVVVRRTDTALTPLCNPPLGVAAHGDGARHGVDQATLRFGFALLLFLLNFALDFLQELASNLLVLALGGLESSDSLAVVEPDPEER
ncbi:hypothetical protein [Myxococcus landrumensis]|uniref:Uncharacterized protein n=1 Tax=Myxococcus landrumensis TaxID=2813577 RepID=A0ABX7NLV9_9BACT|nr:hypothetical protein [Myxococcus landrumus]QSQ17243.1 hypothetical protein JY572_14780 [Myxococcus landrumus]